MLTNLFYYNYYKPYIITGVGSGAAAPQRKKSLAVTSTSSNGLQLNEGSNRNRELHKNIAPRNDVVNYAKNFTSSVVGLKDIAKVIANDAESITMAARMEGMDSAIEWAEEDISDFVSSFNSSKEFSDTQQHNSAISALSNDISDELHENIKTLHDIGIVISKDGYLKFDKERLLGYSYIDLSSSLEEMGRLASTIYAKTTDFLTKPLSNHMNFKQLNYYYSYKYGTMTHNPYRLVESGMMVDYAI